MTAKGNGHIAPRDLAPLREVFGGRLLLKAETASTMDDARELAREGAASGTLVLADAQTGGRGRLGRSWISPAGANIYLSMIVRPKIEAARFSMIAIAAGAALAEALTELAGIDARVKWPNDIRARRKKLCGILAEAGGNEGLEWVVVGAGINVNIKGDELPAELVDIATSLRAETGRVWPRDLVFEKAVAALDEAAGLLDAGNEAEIISRWKARAEALGKRVRVDAPGESFEGRALGIRPDGAFLVEDQAGRERAVTAGDVILIEP